MADEQAHVDAAIDGRLQQGISQRRPVKHLLVQPAGGDEVHHAETDGRLGSVDGVQEAG